jgi:hypothetical protein
MREEICGIAKQAKRARNGEPPVVLESVQAEGRRVVRADQRGQDQKHAAGCGRARPADNDQIAGFSRATIRLSFKVQT